MKFKSDIEVEAGLRDSSGAAGTSGQVLSSNGTTVSWINSGGGVANDVQNTVKAGVAINKGQAVYVTGADGTNIIVGLASNATEATSSKTLGLLNATVAINGFADVIQIGKLAGLDTSTAVVGDPVWLGSNGNLIYGLANKPYAPLHLVYIGVVTRVNANNGEIFINVQNGFELKEIHDVDIVSTPPSNNEILAFEGGSVNLWKNKSISSIGGITGTGTTNYIPKFTGASAIGNSLIYDNGTNVGIGTTSPSQKLVVDGGSSDYTPIWAKSSLLASSKYYSSLLAGYALTSNQSAQFGYVYDTVTPTNSYAHITPFGSAEGSKFMVRADGNVGIGTSSPVAVSGYNALTINGTSGGILYTQVNGTTAGFFSTESSFTVIGESRNVPLWFATNSSIKGGFSAAGNFGIGTTTDAGYKLDVNGTGRFSGYLNANSQASATNGSINIESADPTVRFRVTGGTTNKRIYELRAIAAGTTNDRMELRTWNDAQNAASSLLSITNSGTIGLNTTEPRSVFEISQTLPFQTISSGLASESSTPDQPLSGINFYKHYGIAYSAAIKLLQSGGPNNYCNAHLAFYTADSGNPYIVAPSERMRITSGGNVGIGTISPSTKLNVQIGTASSFSSAGPNDNIRLSSGNTVPWMACDYNGSMAYYGAVNSALVKFAGYNYGTSTNVTMELGQGAIYIHPNNNVSINTATDAGYKLDVNGNTRVNGYVISNNFEATNSANAAIFTTTGTAGSYGVVAQGSSGGARNIFLAGQVGYSNGFTVQYTGSAMYYQFLNGNLNVANGTITASGGFFNSDIKLKDLTDYHYNVSDIKPITYLWKDGRDNKKHVGYSAQEVQKVMPDAVNEDADGMLSVNYIEVLVAKIAELENRIKQLEK